MGFFLNVTTISDGNEDLGVGKNILSVLRYALKGR